MGDLHKLARAMCSIDLADSHWTQELPRLPVPDLWITVSRYLASTKAVLAPSDSPAAKLELELPGLTPEQSLANRRQFERTERLAKQFMLHEGPQLQRDLKEYANKCQNWATEYWLQDMYLSNPTPLPVNSNPFFMFPRQQFNTSEEMLMFATRIIQFSVDFKYRIDQQTIKQDFGSGHGKGRALCMETYKNFFHSYRMPHERMDRLLPQSRRSNHIVVASCNQFYILRLGQDPLDNPYRKDASSQLNETSIFEQLLRIYRISRENAKRNLLLNGGVGGGGQPTTPAGRSPKIAKVGLLTTENRKTWARLHKKLSHCSASQLAGASATTDVSNNQQHLEGENMRQLTQQEETASGSCSPTSNTDSLRLIEDCLFVMCLDSLVRPTPLTSFAAPGVAGGQQVSTGGELTPSAAAQAARDQREADETDVEAANIILTGGGSHLFTGNRWFDKFLQIIVGRDGICGINIEHSASEGITVLRFLEEFLHFIRSNPISERQAATSPNCAALSTNSDDDDHLNIIGKSFNYLEAMQSAATAAGGGGGGPLGADSITSPAYVEPLSPSELLQESDKISPLCWTLDDELHKALDEAELRANKLIENFSLYILRFAHFGRSFIKSQNLSPDAFIQLALQYTFFKMHGRLVSTYESASLRQFRLGRVDNIRANTCEAFDWIRAMLECKRNHLAQINPQQSAGTESEQAKGRPCWRSAEEAFIRAITKQVEILRYTIVGGGPDNHLLALKQLARIRYYDDELPDMFKDPSYQEFLNFRLSTSQLPNESGITVGYGAVTPDGYGCSYNPCEDRIIFCISSFVDCPETSSSRFASTLEESLLEMRDLCLVRGQHQVATTPNKQVATTIATTKTTG